MRWAATVDHTLRRLGFDGEAYWRHHTALLPHLEEELASARAATAATLAPLVRSNNRETFDRVFAAAAAPGGADPRAVRLVESLAPELAGGEDEVRRGRRALREVVHLSLKQLGLHLGFQIPLVIHSWLRYQEHADP